MATTEQIKELGIVGAGGAVFPTYVKLGSEADHQASTWRQMRR